MKTIRLTFGVLTAILLVGLVMSAFAQTGEAQMNEEAARKAQEMIRVWMRSPTVQQAQKNGMKQAMLSNWTGNSVSSSVRGLLHNDSFAEAFGISEDQSQKILGYMPNTQEDPDFQPIHEAMASLPSAENASEETQKQRFDLQMEMQNLFLKKIDDAVDETLSPDQIRRIKEYQIVLMSKGSLVSPSMFEALDLSDEQKKQLEEIRREMKPEYEKHVDKYVENQMLHSKKVDDEIGDKLDGVTDPEEQRRISMEASRKVAEKYPEFLQETLENEEFGKVFAKKLKFKMFDVLTDEQWDRMTDLINNPPDHVKKWIAEFGKRKGNDDNKSGEWKPGPDSWKPGDGIPEGYLRHREEQKARFPRRR